MADWFFLRHILHLFTIKNRVAFRRTRLPFLTTGINNITILSRLDRARKKKGRPEGRPRGLLFAASDVLTMPLKS